METTGGDASWTNRNNKIHKRNIHNMARAGLLDSNKHAKQLCCAEETSEEDHG